jgi:hypothetical protein
MPISKDLKSVAKDQHEEATNRRLRSSALLNNTVLLVEWPTGVTNGCGIARYATLEFCVTLVSLPVEIDPNLGDHTRTRNAENANENGQKKTSPNWRKQLRQDCKTFIQRFDSDRRLQSLHRIILLSPTLR